MASSCESALVLSSTCILIQSWARLSLTILSFQTNDTIAQVDKASLAAAILAWIGSGVALLFGLVHKKTTSEVRTLLSSTFYLGLNVTFLHQTFYGPGCQRNRQAPATSQMIYAASCGSLLVAGASFLTSISLVAWKTAPIISKAFFITFSCVFPTLLLLALIDCGLRKCTPPML